MKRKKLYSCFSVVVAFYFLIISVSSIYAAENNFELFIAQGMEKISDRQYSEALELLQKALEMAPDDTEAIFYTAIAYTRLGELDKAEGLFLRIKDNDAVPTVNFELGRIYYVKEECETSRQYLSDFISVSEDDSLKSYADSLIKDCRETGQGAEEKPYRLNITLGSQYDDNVIIEPQNPIIIQDKKQSDGSAIVYLDTGADLFNKGILKLKADYNFYQSFHFELNDYNVQYHKITPFVEIKLTDIIRPTVGYAYEHTLFGGDRYSAAHVFYTSINIKEGENLSTDIMYKYRDLDYDNSDLFVDNAIRSGNQNIVGAKQNFNADKLDGDVYYFYNDTTADANYWAYTGNRIGAEITYQLFTPLYVTVSGQYTQEQYSEEYPGFTERRKDKTQQYSLVLTYSLSERVSIYLTEDYTTNDSNLNLFEYDRNVVGLLVTVALL